MRCKNHGTDLTSIDGVCASCLRERLIRVIIAQEQSESQSQDQFHRNSNSNSNPTVPRSVSPYISPRKSMNSVNPIVTAQRPCNKPRLNHSVSDKRFYNSPQVAIVNGGCIGGRSTSSNRKNKNPTVIRFPSISNLFRSNSSNNRVSVSGDGGRPSSVTPSSFSNAFSGDGVRRKNKRCVRNRGMSPVRTSDDEQFSDGTSGCESAESCKQTPMKIPVRRGGGGDCGEKSVTELIFRPLVRASPNRILSMNGKTAVDGGFSGDVRAPAVPHLSYVKSFSGNRSRKLADFGRSDPNR